MTDSPSPSLYEQIGGDAGMTSLVDELYRRILDDAQLRPFFDGADMARIKRHQAALLTTVLGGPHPYTGRDLADAHTRLDITDGDYQRVGDHLVGVLADIGAEVPVVDKVVRALVDVRPQIVKDTAHSSHPAWTAPTPPTGVTGPE